MLQELALVEDKGAKYELINLDIKDVTLVPKETLEILLDVFNEYTISTYVYLVSRFFANKKQGFVCQKNHLKLQIGLSLDNRRNDDQINNILKMLNKIGLLEFYYYHEDGQQRLYIDSVTLRVNFTHND